jgi:predicted Zn finger-like uncharacterized protein
MAVRIVCPSCSTALSVKDEHAGRPIKCPKCSATIPPAQPAAPPTPEEPESPAEAPAQPPPEEPAEPEKAAGTKITGSTRPFGKSAKGSAEDEPPRRRRDEDEREERDRDRDRDDDRPRRRRREEEDDRPHRRNEAQGGSNTGTILAIVGGVLLLCCGGAVGLGWYVVTKVRDKAQEIAKNLETWNPAVTSFNYESQKVGVGTRALAERDLSHGKLATDGDLKTVFGADQNKINQWAPKVAQGRTLIWRNGDDFILIAFHPNAESDARVQVKEWRAKNGANAREGEPDDAAFLAKYPPGKVPIEPPGGAVGEGKEDDSIKITAEQLGREFVANEDAAWAKYREKTLVVSGALSSRLLFDRQLFVFLTGGVTGMIKLGAENGAGAALRGQTVRFKGKCTQGFARNVILSNCEVEEVVPANFVVVTADALFADFAKDPEAAGQKYAGPSTSGWKYLHVTDARVTEVGKNEVFLTGPKTKGAQLRLRAYYLDEDAKSFAGLKVGDKVSVKGQSYFHNPLTEEELRLDWATIVP